MDLQLQQEYGSGKTLNLRGVEKVFGFGEDEPGIKTA
jgi:hypothetical protein